MIVIRNLNESVMNEKLAFMSKNVYIDILYSNTQVILIDYFTGFYLLQKILCFKRLLNCQYLHNFPNVDIFILSINHKFKLIYLYEQIV